MAKSKKIVKNRPKTYDPKLKITGSFEDVIKLSVTPTHKDKKDTPKNK